MTRRRRLRSVWLGVLAVLSAACVDRPSANPNVIVVAVLSAPNNLDPRAAADDVSQKAAQLIYNGLMTFDEQLRAVGVREAGELTHGIDRREGRGADCCDDHRNIV